MGRTPLLALALLGLGLLTHEAGCKARESAADPSGCGGICGKYTHCDEGRCVVDYTTAVCDGMSTNYEDDEVDLPPAITSWGACNVDPATLPEFVAVDDSAIPPYDPNVATKLDMNAGDQRLPDNLLMVEMRKIEYAINECLALASCYNNGLGTGRIDFEFRLLGKTGRVDGVNIRAPEELSIYGIIPCARKAVYEHTFPTFNGQHMVVKYSVELD